MLNIHRTRFAPRTFRNAPKENGGTGGDPAPKNLTPEQNLAKARDDLAAANSELERLKPFEAQAADWKNKHDALQSQFDELAKTAQKSKDDLATANSTISTITGERDQAKNDLATAKSSVSRLEKLCNVKGIDPKQAPESVPENTAEKLTYAQWEAKLTAATSDAQRQQIMADLEAASRNGNIAPAAKA